MVITKEVVQKVLRDRSLQYYVYRLHLRVNTYKCGNVRRSVYTYCIAGYFRGVLNFVIFVVRYEVAKISTHELFSVPPAKLSLPSNTMVEKSSCSPTGRI